MNHILRKTLLSTPTSSTSIDKFFRLRQELDFDVRVFLLYGKPLLTVDEDETDILQSINILANVLNAEDVVTINYLNVVADTQIDVLERAGLYRRFDLCRFRRFVQSAATASSKSLRILPGCVAVRTCTERDLDDGEICTKCETWLIATEQLLTVGTLPCARPTELSFGLPWTVLGDIANRCVFVRSRLCTH